MPKEAAKIAVKANPADKRILPRKNALLNAVIADLKGENAMDCTIRDINARSAQIGFVGTLPVGFELYLLDANNKAAHLVRVIWSRAGRAGLQFVTTHALGLRLAPNLKFLWRLFLEAKLREVYRLVTTGIPLELAMSTAGIDEAHLKQMARYAGSDKRFEILIRLGRHVRKRLPRRTLRYHADRRTKI